jgi:hypothetical protein
MTKFNIQNSRVEQMSDSGNNYKVTGHSGNAAFSEHGNVVQTTGTGNKAQVDHTQSFWSLLWGKIKACWKLFGG